MSRAVTGSLPEGLTVLFDQVENWMTGVPPDLAGADRSALSFRGRKYVATLARRRTEKARRLEWSANSGTLVGYDRAVMRREPSTTRWIDEVIEQFPVSRSHVKAVLEFAARS